MNFLHLSVGIFPLQLRSRGLEAEWSTVEDVILLCSVGIYGEAMACEVYFTDIRTNRNVARWTGLLFFFERRDWMNAFRPIEYFHALHRGDRSKFEVALVRVRNRPTLSTEESIFPYLPPGTGVFT